MLSLAGDTSLRLVLLIASHGFVLSACNVLTELDRKADGVVSVFFFCGLVKRFKIDEAQSAQSLHIIVVVFLALYILNK